MADDNSDDLFDSIAADVAAAEDSNSSESLENEGGEVQPTAPEPAPEPNSTAAPGELKPFPIDHPLYMEVIVGPQPEGWENLLAFKLERLDVLQDRKERHMLTYLNDGVPEAYYRSWTQDANQLFTLSVRMRKRARKFKVEDRLPKRKSNGYMGFDE